VIPTTAVLQQIADLLAADATTLAPAADACHVHLAMAPFTPSADLLLAGLTEADFDGHTALNAGIGPQESYTDPVTGLRIVQLLEPAGGWHWVTSGVTNLPETIYGYYVTDNANAVLYGSALLPTPVTLNAVGQGIDLPYVRLTFLSGSPI
jgi:hypothetical protein